MVLEEIFKPKWIKHRPYIAFVFGFFFTFIGFLIALKFFKNSMSVAMIFLITILLTPTLMMLIRREEQIESKYGLKHFFRNHKDIFEVYLFAFLGVFLAFIVIGIGMYDYPNTYDKLFEFQTELFGAEEGLSMGAVEGFVQGTVDAGLGQALSLFSHNLLVVIICFILSFFYGATAIFLIILNGSVFANFIVFVIKTIADNTSQGIQAFFFFLIHLLPEVSAFLIAAIAGGVVSKAVLHEKKGSQHFKNVFKDAAVLMLIAAGLVLLSALLEVFVTTRLFQAFF
jgi:uncharacterized membrane protein SpoIIM required for sporulation